MDISSRSKRLLRVVTSVIYLALWFLHGTQAHAVIVEGVTPSHKFKVMRISEKGELTTQSAPVPASVEKSSAAVCLSSSTTLLLADDDVRVGSAFCNRDDDQSIVIGDLGISTSTGAGYWIQPNTCDSLDGASSVNQGDTYCRLESGADASAKVGITTTIPKE